MNNTLTRKGHRCAIVPGYSPGPGTRWKKIAIMLGLMAIIVFKQSYAYAQQVLNGTVLDERGSPLPGASIKIKGTERGTVSDVDGKFLLEVPSPETMVLITYQGYFPLEVAVGNDREQTFTLQLDEEQSKLDEVVVVGFGTQKKVTVTGSVTSVSVKDLEMSTAPSLSNALAGRMPGIITRQTSGEPGYDQAQVFIRGMGTWVSRTPLVLVDGVERGMSALNSINAQEIESFSVLKDASATAVYGVRGANGVILITTKRGVQGRPKVTLRSETGLLTAQRMPKYIDGIEYAQLWNEAYRNMGQDEFFSPEEIAKYASGEDPYLYPNVDWTNEIMKKNTYQTINNLSVNGGTEIIRYYANVGYTEQSGLWKVDEGNPYNTNINMRRYNLRSNIDVNVTKNLLFEFGLGAVVQQGNYPARSAPDIFD